MCGRYKITKPVSKTSDIVKKNIKVEDNDNYNAHPTQKLPIIKSYTNGKALELCEWGLIPAWSKKLEKFSPLINARKETLMEKITFKNLIQTSRCMILADGYYEWKREEKNKTPYYFTKENNELMFLAAIHQNNQFCIITREATEEISKIHHREPLIVNQSQINDYLNVKKDAMEILNSIKPPKLKFHAITKDVNNPINNKPSLINKLNE
jgi:putative SOS response-associated peptidase YedK|tara:strand:- start:678 stop:1307 length:630 start_codon:yes stop_codon:yes gene_type:complete